MYAFLIAVAAALGGLLFGYDTSVISGAILFLREQFHLNSVETELAVSIVLAGAALGAAVAGYFGDRFGRKRVLIADAVPFAIFSLVTSLANGFGLFLLARFLVGVTSMITPRYIAEVAPARLRGGLVTLNQLAIVIGIVVAYYADYLLADSANWRGMFITAVAPSIVLLVALIFLPESPRWTATHGRFDDAREVLTRIENSAEAQLHLDELRELTTFDKLKFSDLFAARFRRPVLVGVGLAIFQHSHDLSDGRIPIRCERNPHHGPGRSGKCRRDRALSSAPRPNRPTAAVVVRDCRHGSQPDPPRVHLRRGSISPVKLSSRTSWPTWRALL